MHKKTEFILDLLNSKSLNDKQRNKVIELTMREIRNHEAEFIGKITNRIKELSQFQKSEIETIKKKLDSINIGPRKEDIDITKDADIIKCHRPQEMVKLLYQFQTYDIDFKWFTHMPTDGMEFNYKEYQERAIKKLDDLLKKSNINFNLWSQLMFTIGNPKVKKWEGLEDLRNWSCPQVKEWCLENPNQHPGKSRLRIKNKTVKWSTNMKLFKFLIVFDTNPKKFNISSWIQSFIKGYESEMSFTFSEEFERIGSSVKLYCQTYILLKSIRHIVDWCRDFKDISNKVNFHMKSNNECIELLIQHKESYFNNSFVEDKSDGLSGHFHMLREQLFSIVDWTWTGPIKDTSNYLHLSCLETNTTQNVYFESSGKKKKTRKTKLNKCNSKIIPKPQNAFNGIEHQFSIYKRNKS